MTQLFLVAFPLAALAEVSSGELLAPGVDLAESDGDHAESSRRLVGPPSTWSVRHWSRGHIRDQNDDRCPQEEPYGGEWCQEYQSGLECYYEEVCCPDHKRCTARKVAHCRHLYGPTHQGSDSWDVSTYGQIYHKRKGLCYLGHASDSNSRRRAEDELQGEPEMAVQEEVDGLLKEDSSLSRRLVGPAYTWPVDPWTPNSYDCPWNMPSDGTMGEDYERGLTCSYERVCCPDGRRCVATKQATCTMMLPSGCKWETSFYGTRHWSRGVCHIVHSSDTGRVPSPSPYVPPEQPLFG